MTQPASQPDSQKLYNEIYGKYMEEFGEHRLSILDKFELPDFIDFPGLKKDSFFIRDEHGSFVVLETGAKHATPALASAEIRAMGKNAVFQTDNWEEDIKFSTGLSKETRVNLVKAQYVEFRRVIDPVYQAYPEDWYVAHTWLSRHPAFYHRREADSSNWDTASGMSSAYIVPGRHEDGSNYVLLEHGASIRPDCTSHYHDPSMDVVSPDFEAAYVDFAKEVQLKYRPDGYELSDTSAPPLETNFGL